MRHLRRLALLLAACAVAARGQTPLTVGYQKTIDVVISGATAAYSLDSRIAEAGASDSVVEITGKMPGSTNVVIVTAGGVQTLMVTVPVPPPVLPPGFEPPVSSASGESGNYEFRYNSDPGQITNSVELKRSQGQSFERLQVVNANLFSAGASTSAVGFPLLSYEISRPRRDFTFLDQTVVNSPFTLDGYMVRGLHLRAGDWQFHGGFTSIATFQGLFLATDREYVAGVSRSFKIDDKTSAQANVYYFRNPDVGLPVPDGGTAATLVFRYADKDKAKLLAEWGFSHGVGFAARGGYDDEKNHVAGNFRTQSRSFASLAVNNQHGTFGDLDASRKLSSRLYASLDLNQSNFNLPLLQQNTFVVNGLLTAKLSRNFSFTGGSSYSAFQSKAPAGPSIRAVNLPAGIDFSSRHFGGGFQYQRAVNFQAASGNDYAANLRGSASRFHATAFFRHSVQVPTVAAIFALIPGLQDALERAGIIASTPDQLAELLRNTSLLATLGFSTPFTVDLAPSRNDEGASLTWLSNSRQRRQLDLSWFNSDTRLVQGKFSLTTATLSYAQRLNNSNNIIGSAALVRTLSGGVADTHPLFSVSLQHRFYSVPGFIMPGRHGVIEGHVFRDDDTEARYSGRQPALAGVEVRLDEDRVTHTDANGFYSFHHVPYGVHRVQARLQSADPFFFTTDSPATTDINNTVDFGINFAKGRLYGFVKNDAGAGVNGVTVELRGQRFTRRVQTGDNGKFSFPGLPAGDYTVSTVAESYPAGYSLQTLAPQQVTVAPGKPATLRFDVKALRSIAGRVMVYDRKLLRTAPLAAAVVRLSPLSLETKTGDNGAYIFRNLPAGNYTVSIEFAGKQISRAVVLPAEPSSVRDIELNVGAQ